MQCVKHLHRFLFLPSRHEKMVVVDTCDHVAADACLPQRRGKCRCQTYCGKIRVDGERDPRGNERDRQPKISGILFGHDDRKPFRLADRSNDAVLVKRTAKR